MNIAFGKSFFITHHKPLTEKNLNDNFSGIKALSEAKKDEFVLISKQSAFRKPTSLVLTGEEAILYKNSPVEQQKSLIESFKKIAIKIDL